MFISVALLGFGASGAFLSIYPRIFEKNVHQVTTYLAWAFSFSCVGSLVIICRLTLDPFQISAFPSQIFILFIYYLALFLPFFFAGLCISLLLCRFIAGFQDVEWEENKADQEDNEQCCYQEKAA